MNTAYKSTKNIQSNQTEFHETDTAGFLAGTYKSSRVVFCELYVWEVLSSFEFSYQLFWKFGAEAVFLFSVNPSDFFNTLQLFVSKENVIYLLYKQCFEENSFGLCFE